MWARLAARGERGVGQRAVREGGSLRLPGGPRTVGVHAPGGRRGERDAAGASGASARVAGRAGGARGPLRGSAGPSGELGRARVGEGVWAGRCTGPGRGKRGKGKRAGLVFAGLGLRVWVFLSIFSFFSISKPIKV